ncbi:MAG TPA: peptidoglycan-binding domain-containing protein [Thermoanaerobaculia bacterium]|nr:peptidoglycan-binding domain-containing protein [Thermoanaerobaculia bacterium]
MPQTSFVQPGLTLQKGIANSQQVRDLQQALRELGYLRGGVDGNFGSGTEAGVKALQFDLLNNDGKGSDGQAPVMIKSYNKARVASVTGVCDQNTAQCIVDMLNDPQFIRLPIAADPVQANKSVVAKIAAAKSVEVPIRFIASILKQESDLKHYNETDAVITLGLDTNNAAQTFAITSRGYGAGQFTIFHHPPRQEEVDDFMNNVDKNLSKAEGELREKFDKFVNGPSSKADDRQAEIGSGPLRVCKYASSDPRYLTDCRQCAVDAGSRNIVENVTPVYNGSPMLFTPTQYYASGNYSNIPKREAIGCDWPYAVRRYNGGGINSYHYQVRILRNVRDLVL